MKIAFFVPSFPSTSETFILNQIISLLEQRHEIKIFAFKKGKDAVIHDDLKKYNLLEKVVYIQEPLIPKLERYWRFFLYLINHRKNINFKKALRIFWNPKCPSKFYNLRNFTKYQWIFDCGEFDVLHAHFGFCGKYLAEMKSFGYYSSSKFLVTFHGYDLSPHLLEEYKKDYEIIFNERILCTVNSQYLKDLLVSIYDEKKIEILPVGLDTSKFTKRKFSTHSKIQLLFVGRLVEFKGPHYTIEILKVLIDKGLSNVHLIIIGEGDKAENIKGLVQKYNLEERVHFRGAISQEEIIDTMENCDIFLLPGMYNREGRAETQGLVIQEAQSMEIPVVVSDAGGMKFGLISGVTGYIVPEGDIMGFVERIEFLIKNEKLRKEMGKKGRRFVENEFDSTILRKRLMLIYNSLDN